jgi:sarcosine oxidase
VTLGGNLWEQTARAAPATFALTGERAADVVVVGAGFAGLSTTLHLAEAGASVVLIEAGAIGCGASGRSSGQINPGLKRSDEHLARLLGARAAERLIRFGDDAPGRLVALIREHGIDCDLQNSGWVRAAHSTAALRILEGSAKNLRGRNRDVALLDAVETAKCTGTDFYVGGLLHREAWTMQPMSLLRGMAEACLRKGAEIATHSPALRIAGQDPWRVVTPAGTVRARTLVLATGAYTDDLWPGLRTSIVTVESSQIASASLSSTGDKAILPGGVGVSDTRKLANFFRKDGGGRLMIGGRGTVDRDLSNSTARSIVRAAGERFPSAQDLRWQNAWSGSVEFNIQDLPQLCRLAPNAWSVLGFGGRGIALATALGAVLARKITEDESVDFDYPVTPLRSIPWHRLRAPALTAAMAYYRAKDALGFAS